jgi:hypothetical protein
MTGASAAGLTAGPGGAANRNGVAPAGARGGAANGAGQGAAIGVICLDTSFTKIPGHIRNPATFGFPVICQVVPGATPARVVTRPDPALLQPFTEAAVHLEAAGVSAITSACGFLALFQA